MRKGFSLVELSIVLVILGLLTGGILAGQSLIRAAELRAVTTEHGRYIAAIQSFRDKYMAVPGDLREASRFWNLQVSGSGCTNNTGAAVNSPGACDGNGSGAVDAAPVANQSGERYQFWRHLALAGLIEGSYTGLAGSTTSAHTPGSNAPASKLSNGGWSTLTNNSVPGTAGTNFAGNYGSFLSLDAWSGTSSQAILKPEEAWGIDTKMDDGRPGRGKIIVWYISTCTDAGSAAGSQNNLDANYLLTSSATGCGLIFMQAY